MTLSNSAPTPSPSISGVRVSTEHKQCLPSMKRDYLKFTIGRGISVQKCRTCAVFLYWNDRSDNELTRCTFHVLQLEFYVQYSFDDQYRSFGYLVIQCYMFVY